jgi:hypothetical protein
MYKLPVFSAILALMFCTTIFGQITVSTNQYMPAPGSEIRNHFDSHVTAAYFDSLTAGSGQLTWDFSSRTYDTGIVMYSVNPAGVREIDSFPSANLVFMYPSGPDTSWSIYSSVPGSFTFLGSVANSSPTDFVLKYFDIAPDWVFPITYNSEWTSYRLWNDSNEFNHTNSFDTTRSTVNAWGTAKYHSKTVPCLRVVSTEKVLSKAYDNSNVLLDSSETDITTVTFIAGGFTSLVSASKITAGGLFTSYVSSATGDFLDSPTDVNEADNGSLPGDFALSQNYPNPFNPSTEIDLSIPNLSRVNLVVYNVLGEEVRVLVDKMLGAGSYIVDWDGKDQAGTQAASGVYFYRLTAGQFTETKKMILLK